MASSKGQVSDDEEPDYMSDDFLKQCVQTDIRPGLLTSRATKRTYDAMDGRKKTNKSKEELERERIRSVQEALKVPIKEDNKGFKMLQKMGYKPGSSLGKDDASKNAIKEPIQMDIKKGRGGLGQEQHAKEKLEKFEKVRQEENSEFRLRKQSVAKAREVFNDLKKAQFACQSLDEDKGITQPTAKYYWPEVKKVVKEEGLLIEESEADADPISSKKRINTYDESSESESELEDEDESIPDEVKLDSVSSYLRDTYFYCLWCGVKYESTSDMESSCPGTDKDSH